MLKQRQELLDFALQLAKAAAEQIMPHYHNCVVNTKPDGTEVTEADRRAEEVVREKFRFCGDCLQHALVCRGRIHVAVDTLMQPWDSAAIIPCIEEAGGIATTLSGHRKGIVFGGSLLTSCDTSLHHEIIELLQPNRASGYATGVRGNQ